MQCTQKQKLEVLFRTLMLAEHVCSIDSNLHRSIWSHSPKLWFRYVEGISKVCLFYEDGTSPDEMLDKNTTLLLTPKMYEKRLAIMLNKIFYDIKDCSLWWKKNSIKIYNTPLFHPLNPDK